MPLEIRANRKSFVRKPHLHGLCFESIGEVTGIPLPYTQILQEKTTQIETSGSVATIKRVKLPHDGSFCQTGIDVRTVLQKESLPLLR